MPSSPFKNTSHLSHPPRLPNCSFSLSLSPLSGARAPLPSLSLLLPPPPSRPRLRLPSSAPSFFARFPPCTHPEKGRKIRRSVTFNDSRRKSILERRSIAVVSREKEKERGRVELAKISDFVLTPPSKHGRVTSRNANPLDDHGY